jgi:hypothetical protein
MKANKLQRIYCAGRDRKSAESLPKIAIFDFYD